MKLKVHYTVDGLIGCFAETITSETDDTDVLKKTIERLLNNASSERQYVVREVFFVEEVHEGERDEPSSV